MTDLLKTLLLDRAVLYGDFPLASGQFSNYYIDARRVTMSAEGMDVIGKQALERFVLRGWLPRVVGGLTLGADPVAYAIMVAAYKRGLVIDAFSVRKQPKEHGTGRRIEGCYSFGDRVVIVEDVLTTGRSVLEATQVLTNAGAQVLGVFVVVDREAGGRERLESAGHQVETLITATELSV